MNVFTEVNRHSVYLITGFACSKQLYVMNNAEKQFLFFGAVGTFSQIES